MKKSIRVGFLGSGSIARSHAYALDALKFYYPDAPNIQKAVVASPTPEHRESFADLYGFEEALSPDDLWERDDLDALYILGSNTTHTPQLIRASQLPKLQRIYVEKPLGTSIQDIHDLEALNTTNHGKFIMVGFQFLQKSAIRKALAHWRSGAFGEPIHFRAEYLHSSYLNEEYRRLRQHRFLPTPIDGAAADLGSHPLSLLTAFLGNSLAIKDAGFSGSFPGVPDHTDLCTTALIKEERSGAHGTFLASRVSAGTGDLLILEFYCTKGALRFTTRQPDSYETFLPEEGWRLHEVNSDYSPASKFPSDYLPSGWLRALVHNHYLFLSDNTGADFIPDLSHGIQVQRLLQQIADHIRS